MAALVWAPYEVGMQGLICGRGWRRNRGRGRRGRLTGLTTSIHWLAVDSLNSPLMKSFTAGCRGVPGRQGRSVLTLPLP